MIYMPVKPVVNMKKNDMAKDDMGKFYNNSKSAQGISNISKGFQNNAADVKPEDNINNFMVVNDANNVKKASETPDIPKADKKKPSNSALTGKLQEAVLWSEILGKPLCKRRKRR